LALLRKGTLFFLATLFLTNCGPGGHEGNTTRRNPYSTGHKNEQGVDYQHNGNVEMEKALKKEELDPTPEPKPKSADGKPLRERLKEFEISRFAKEADKPSRFGDQRFTIEFFFRDGEVVNFSGQFKGTAPNLTIDVTSNGYKLAGKLTDEPKQSKGDFTLSKDGESAHIFYWAYRARLNVREDEERKAKPGSGFETQLKELRENTFGWVHNWSVVKGPAFFIVDIIHTSIPHSPMQQTTLPPFSLKGESLRTGEQMFPVTTVNNPAAKEATLVGNAERGSGRMFSVKLEDPQSKEINEVMLDVDPIDPQPEPVIPIDEEPLKPNPDVPVEPKKPVIPKPRKRPTAEERKREAERQPELPKAKPKTEEPLTATRPYLRDVTDAKNFPRTVKMVSDFNKNLDIPGVREWIGVFRSRIPIYKRDYRADLIRFYKFANPFRGMIEAVAQAYDVSSSFAYLTVIESTYFYGGRYEIQKAPNSSALGPYQLLDATAIEVHLRIGGAHDERRYFAPSSCGGALYVGKRVNQFFNRDTTISILGYFQGGGKAEELTKRWNYDYATIDQKAAIKKEFRDYVNKKLAVYFISRNMPRFGFSIPKDAPRELPDNGTVMPVKEISNPKCRGVFSAMM
jgi:hypothetical protein